MNTHNPARQTQPPPTPEIEMLWSGLMFRFEVAGQDVLTSQHALETQGTQRAFDALIRAETQRRRAVNGMLYFLDAMDDIDKRSC
jgi:hypothetical protein